MIQIIPERKQQSFADRLLTGLGKASQSASQLVPEHLMRQQQMQQENTALQRLTGQDVTGLSPELKKSYFENIMKGQLEKSKSLATQLEGQKHLQTASKALDTLEGLVGKKGIGFSDRLNPFSEARFNRGLFESTQAAVLPLFKSMFPRGMTEKEFKFIQDNYIPQPGDTEQKIKGKIQGLRQLLQEQTGEAHEGGQESGTVEISHGGHTYDLPPHLVEAFKKKHGIK